MRRLLTIAGAALLTLQFSVSASASLMYTFIGQWEVDDGPFWGDQPLAYSGLTAAALLFGGSPSDYAISTLGTDPADVNNMAWYSVLGLGGGHMFAEDYLSTNSSQAAGFYYSGNAAYRFGDITEAASAYVDDNAEGAEFTNFAFLINQANGGGNGGDNGGGNGGWQPPIDPPVHGVSIPGTMTLLAIGALLIALRGLCRRRD